MKKLFAVLVALTLVLSMGTIALAADNGTITINNTVIGSKYDIYRIFDLVSYDAGSGNASYKLSTEWKDFVADDYFEINENGYVEWKKSLEDDHADVKAFVELAFAYAENEANGIEADDTATADGDTVTFSNLPLGYYLIDTSLGTLCAITTAKPAATVTEKNQMPDIDKYVQEDSKSNNNQNDEGWLKVNDAEIGQTVYYKSTIKVGAGATNYIMHDTMTEGLTFNTDSVEVKLADGTEVATSNYRVVTNPTDNCTFEVEFEDSFIAGLAKDATFTVYYTATLNEKAKVEITGNDNTVYLTCGENSEWKSDEHTTTTYTWKIDIFKYTEIDGANVALPGAEFQLLRAKGDIDTAIGLVSVTTVNGEATTVPTYRLATEKDSADVITYTITTGNDGKFNIVGLDEGTYYLHESKAPAGYNELADDITVTITSTNYDSDKREITHTVDNLVEGLIKVENKTGTLLPETGGIGTTIFYIVGITLMLGAAIILISKKRMASFA